jgi:hypothetical protein
VLVRSTLSEGHSHVWELPAKVPAKRSVFFSGDDGRERSGEHYHTHALFFGGDRGFGSLQSEEYGNPKSSVWSVDGKESVEMLRGDVNPDQPDPRRPHGHVVTVLA